MPKVAETSKRWFIFCEPCSYREIIEDITKIDLFEIKTAKIPGGAPFIDPETKKTKTKPSTSRPKRFKCPKCGRGVTAKNLPEVYKKAYKSVDDEKKKQEADLEKKKRIEDGKPHVRQKKDEEFLG